MINKGCDENMKKMKMINQTLMMSFLAVIATTTVVFPILSLAQNKKQHKEFMKEFKKNGS